MKGTYLLIRTEKLSSRQTPASLANVQSILLESTVIPRGPTQNMSRLIIWIMRYFWFIVSARLLFHHLPVINTWHNTLCLQECWHMGLAEESPTLSDTVVLSHCRTLLWVFLSSCEGQSRKNSTGLSTCMISTKMDISLKRYVSCQKCESVPPSWLCLSGFWMNTYIQSHSLV